MRTRRSLQLALAASVAILAVGTTFAWAGVLVGGHRADRIGTFEPVARVIAPPGAPSSSGSTATTRHDTTSASLAPTDSLAPSPSLTTTFPGEATQPATAFSATTGHPHSDDSTTSTTDNGRSNDD